jgi:hypothetical protein
MNSLFTEFSDQFRYRHTDGVACHVYMEDTAITDRVRHTERMVNNMHENIEQFQHLNYLLSFDGRNIIRKPISGKMPNRIRVTKTETWRGNLLPSSSLEGWSSSLHNLIYVYKSFCIRLFTALKTLRRSNQYQVMSFFDSIAKSFEAVKSWIDDTASTMYGNHDNNDNDDDNNDASPARQKMEPVNYLHTTTVFQENAVKKYKIDANVYTSTYASTRLANDEGGNRCVTTMNDQGNNNLVITL